MLDPYKMVYINIIASALVLTGTLVFKFIYPKKKINLFALLVIISILPIISIFRAGDYESGDFNIHVRRAMEFYSLLSQGNIMPTWAADLNATYGYPLFAFNYTLPYYIISLFHLLGFSFITSLKLFLASAFVLSGIFMYLFSRNNFKNSLAAFTASVFYIFNPYHLISAHFKITIGELLAFTLIPIVFYFLDKYLNYTKIAFLLLSGLFLGLLILSHIFIALSLIPIIIFYLIIKTRNLLKSITYSISIITISLLVSAFQWAAPLIYKPYLLTSASPNDFNLPYFPNISDLLYSPWRFGFLFQGPSGEISFLLGYAQILILLMAILFYLKDKVKKQYRSMAVLWITLTITIIFFITPYSIFIWKLFPLITNVGSQRLLIAAAFCISLLAGYVILNINKKWVIYGIVIFAIGTTILNWGQRRVIPTINDNILRQNLSLGTTWGDTHFYAIPKWVNPKQLWFSKIPDSHLEILDGEATVRNLNRTSINHRYLVNAKTPTILKENTLYFPGWNATINGKPINIVPDKNGVISLSLPKGNYILTLHFEDLFPFYLSKVISLTSILLIFLYCGFYVLKNKLIKLPKF